MATMTAFHAGKWCAAIYWVKTKQMQQHPSVPDIYM